MAAKGNKGGARARKTPAEPKEPPDPRKEHMRRVTGAVRSNMAQVRWAWEYPLRAFEAVSVPMQLATTLLTLVAVCPLEEMVTDLNDDPMTKKHRAAMDIPDLRPDTPDGFIANLGRWRQAIAQGRVEMFLHPRGHLVEGMRASLPATADEEVWSMELGVERLAAIVFGLIGGLPYWGLPLNGVMPLSSRPS